VENFQDDEMKTEVHPLRSPLILDFTVKEDNLDNDVLTLIQMIIPTLPGISSNPKITLTQQTVGTINQAFKVQIDHEILMVRINSGNLASKLADRNRELLIISLAHSYGFGPTLYAKYNNGYVVSFIIGEVLELHQLRDPFYYKTIIPTVAYWHNLKTPDTVEPQINVNPWSTIDKWYVIADNLGVDIESIKKEIEEMRQHLVEKYDDRNTFTHNDLNFGNIIYTGENKMMFVDYEFSGIGNRYFDIANHFCEWCGLDFDISRIPTKEEQLTWLQIYLSHYDQKFPQLPKEEQQTQLSQFACIIQSYELISHLYWSLWGKIMSSGPSTNTFGYANYSLIRLNSYYLRKKAWFPCDPQ